ncbi:hypothetical protein J1N35_041854 [Gossypium stocksii]|uniref:Uncharacterized protein n=1 Tax=Gossypium stocksii TaxID=47602 RepID=A0A9D3UGI7_9ROSI|nr:hypothetical protein J1N35_041854 [Gossypium stocksii]
MPYADPTIQEYISVEFLADRRHEELHEVDLWGRIEEEWVKFHAKYIYIGEDKYNFIPMTRQLCCKKPKQPCMNPRLGVHASMKSSSTPTPHEALMGALPLGQVGGKRTFRERSDCGDEEKLKVLLGRQRLL